MLNLSNQEPVSWRTLSESLRNDDLRESAITQLKRRKDEYFTQLKKTIVAEKRMRIVHVSRIISGVVGFIFGDLISISGLVLPGITIAGLAASNALIAYPDLMTSNQNIKEAYAARELFDNALTPPVQIPSQV